MATPEKLLYIEVIVNPGLSSWPFYSVWLLFGGGWIMEVPCIVTVSSSSFVVGSMIKYSSF